MLSKNKRPFTILTVIALLLCIPLVAMQFTGEVNWTASDFLVVGFLLASAGLAIELTLRIVKKKSHRIIFCIGILAVLLLVWAELAVGVFGTPFAGS